MDAQQLWDDTMLIVWTDHGFLLGEHQSWAKVWLPYYEEIAHTPFFVWDPRAGLRGERRASLVQPSIDLAPTLLEYFEVERPAEMLGRDLAPAIADDTAVREAAIFGMHGTQVNVTDGRYVYMRGPADDQNQPLFNYTLMPTAMHGFLDADSLRRAEMHPPFDFTRGYRTMRVPARSWTAAKGEVLKTRLWDVENDPGQAAPLENAATERVMIDHLVRLMRECDAPPEQYARLGLEGL
jgi:hypothetical protein